MSDMTCKPSLLLRCVDVIPDSVSGDSAEPVHGLKLLGIGQGVPFRDLRLGGNLRGHGAGVTCRHDLPTRDHRLGGNPYVVGSHRCVHVRCTPLGGAAQPARRMVPGEAQAQVGEPEEPAEILLHHDLGDARFIGVHGHVIVRRVVEVLDKTIISCGVLAVELLPEEFIGVLGGGEKAQAVWWIRPTDIAGVDLEDAVPGPCLKDEVW